MFLLQSYFFYIYVFTFKSFKIIRLLVLWSCFVNPCISFFISCSYGFSTFASSHLISTFNSQSTCIVYHMYCLPYHMFFYYCAVFYLLLLNIYCCHFLFIFYIYIEESNCSMHASSF